MASEVGLTENEQENIDRKRQMKYVGIFTREIYIYMC